MSRKLTAADRIGQLHGKGWSNREIADSLGRSPSYVSNISRGKTPGTNVAGPLGTLTRRKGPGGRPVDVPDRMTKYGEKVRTRLPEKAWRTPKGGWSKSVKPGAELDRALARAAREGKSAHLSVTFDDVEVEYDDGSFTGGRGVVQISGTALHDAGRRGTAKDLEEWAVTQDKGRKGRKGPKVLSATGVRHVTITVGGAPRPGGGNRRKPRKPRGKR
jgi:Helix-turn-helix domain